MSKNGTKKCVLKGLRRLGHETINTSVIERSNLMVRSMSAYQVRRSLAFARRAESRLSLAWWCLSVMNFVRVNRSLRLKLEEPVGRQKFLERTPAMASGVTDRVWSVLELMRFVVFGGDEIISGHYRTFGLSHASLTESVLELE